MKRPYCFLLGFIVLSAFIVAKSWSAPPQQSRKNNLSDYMQLKLKHSQEILKGLALEDFDTIAKNAQELSLLSRGTNWNVL